MRQTCLNEVFELAKADERIFFIGSDLGVGTLDKFKEEVMSERAKLKPRRVTGNDEPARNGKSNRRLSRTISTHSSQDVDKCLSLNIGTER